MKEFKGIRRALWDKYCALPRFSFLLNRSGGVGRWENKSGGWNDTHEVSQLIESAQDEINEQCEKLAEQAQEIERLNECHLEAMKKWGEAMRKAGRAERELARLKSRQSGVVLPERADVEGYSTGSPEWHAAQARNDCIDEVTRLNSSDVIAGEPFQSRVMPWLLGCFGETIAGDVVERNHRFLEEALELVQACGCSAAEAHKLVEYVYGRKIGEKAQEIGGVMVTLAALCLAQGLDMHAAGEDELDRINQPDTVERIREKQKRKPAMSPLPGSYPARSTAPPTIPTTQVLVERELRPVLSMILSALDRDAAEGKAVRGEMAEELRAILSSKGGDV